MKHFSKVPIATGERSRQNLSATTNFTADFGRLDPVYHCEVCPNDDVELDISQFMRMAPMPYPVQGSIRQDLRVFFVPYRILQPDYKDPGQTKFSWDNYITGVSNTSHPYAQAGALKGFLASSAYASQDNYGFPTGVYGTMWEQDSRRLFSLLGLPKDIYNYVASGVITDVTPITLWPFQAYQRIWWDYYRNSELILEELLPQYFPALAPGLNSLYNGGSQTVDKFLAHFLMPRYACFPKDYFTTAKVNPQSGSTASTVGTTLNVQPTTSDRALVLKSNGEVGYSNLVTVDDSAGIQRAVYFGSLGSTTSVLSQFSIEVLRRANALQKYLERNNIVGSRLIERFLARFGVAPSSQVMQMSEYLGGTSGTYNIGAIMSSTDTSSSAGVPSSDGFGMSLQQDPAGGSIQGLSTGAGAINLNSGKIKYHAKEFGCLMVISSIVPNVVYTEGLHKKWKRGLGDRFDYLTPEMDRLGYEPVLRNEIQYDESFGNQPFGYVPAYSSYKYQNSIKAGDLVLVGTNSSMDCVNIEREFGIYSPSLTADFTQINPDERLSIDRNIFTFPGNLGEFDHFVGYAHVECHVNRSISDDGLPALDPDLDDQKKKILVENGGVRF